MSAKFADMIKQAMEDCKLYETCMCVEVSRRGSFVELQTDTSRPTYSETIPGIVGGDCGLIRDMETKEIIGIKLELKTNKLVVQHDGPIRINSGFLKADSP